MAPFLLDTSALVKRYHDEPGTERVDDLLETEGNEIYITSLTVIESVSAFRRKYNRGDVTENQMNRLVSAFFQEALEDFVILPLEESLLTFSFDLVLDDDLRTLDSLQLSAALTLSKEVDTLTFVTSDAELASVGSQRDLQTLQP